MFEILFYTIVTLAALVNLFLGGIIIYGLFFNDGDNGKTHGPRRYRV